MPDIKSPRCLFMLIMYLVLKLCILLCFSLVRCLAKEKNVVFSLNTVVHSVQEDVIRKKKVIILFAHTLDAL
jgi:hypothetical protein